MYREDDDTSFYLSQDDFKEIVQDAGGKFGASITGKTTIVVLGALEKEWSAKEPDLWTGSGKEKALTKQKTIGTGQDILLKVPHAELVEVQPSASGWFAVMLIDKEVKPAPFRQT